MFSLPFLINLTQCHLQLQFQSKGRREGNKGRDLGRLPLNFPQRHHYNSTIINFLCWAPSLTPSVCPAWPLSLLCLQQPSLFCLSLSFPSLRLFRCILLLTLPLCMFGHPPPILWRECVCKWRTQCSSQTLRALTRELDCSGLLRYVQTTFGLFVTSWPNFTYFVNFILHRQNVLFLFFEMANVMFWISICFLLKSLTHTAAVVRLSCMVVAAAERCPAEAAVCEFLHTHWDGWGWKGARGSWIHFSSILSSCIVSTADVSHVAQPLLPALPP